MSLIIDADGEYLSGSGVTLLPTGCTEATFAIWVKRASASSTGQSYAYAGKDAATQYGSLWIAHNGEGPDCFAVPAGLQSRAASPAGANSTSWQLLVFTYKNGVATKTYAGIVGGSLVSFTGETAVAAYNADVDNIRIGLGEPTASVWYPRARLAHCALWDKELTATEAGELFNGGTAGAGKNPQAVQAANLKFYAPLTSDATVTVSGISLSATGTLTYDGADNPNVDSYGGTTAYTLAVDSGTYTLSGQDLLVPLAVTATLDAGTYSITGQDIGFGGSVTYSLTLDSGAYNMTSETPVIGISMGLDSGSYSSTGQDLTLSASIGGGGTTYSLSLDAGDYVVTGQDLAMIMSYLASLDTGSYTATGSNVRLVSSTEPVIISSGTHTISVSIKIGI